jgi:hypothetical protein
MESGSVRSLQTHHFTYQELEEATDSFSGAMEIGDGGFGTVYKGIHHITLNENTISLLLIGYSGPVLTFLGP